jgi:hypothetical protein
MLGYYHSLLFFAFPIPFHAMPSLLPRIMIPLTQSIKTDEALDATNR